MTKIFGPFFGPLLKRQFWLDLYREIDEDQVSNGAAALSYYFLLAIFPAIIFMLSVLPYLPIQNLSTELMSVMYQALPDSAAKALETTILEITTTKKQGLLSFGALFTLWSASAGLYAVMQQLDITYDVRETRPYWKVRGLSVILTIAWGALIVSAFSLIVAGGAIQNYFNNTYVLNPAIPVLFQVFRWVMIVALMFGGFSIIYYFGTNVTQQFKFITPGAFLGVSGLIGATLLFRVYVADFGNYSASYGSLGAVITLMLWFYIAGHMILIGSEINALVEASPTKMKSINANHEFAKREQPENPTPSQREATQTSLTTAERPAQPAPSGARS